MPDGYYDERRAIVRMAAIIEEHHDAALDAAEGKRAEADRPATFREVAHEWLSWLEVVRGARPSTLRDYRSQLAEPGTPHTRGRGVCEGRT